MTRVYSFIFIILFCASSSFAYEKIYYEDEEYSLRYIIRDYSYISGYNLLWQQVSDYVDIEYYDEFIHKDFSKLSPKKARSEVIEFIKNYEVVTGLNNSNFNNKNMIYPVTNMLIIQNKALLKARKVLNDLPIHEKTSLVYLAAALSYIKSDGLYEFDKLQRLLKEWQRLGGDDFEDIPKEEIEKRKTLFTYIIDMKKDPVVTDEFINIIKSEYYYILLFKSGFFDLFNIAEYNIVAGNEVSVGVNLVNYFTEYIKASYMDIIVNEPFRLDAYGKKVNHYFTIYNKENNLNKKLDNFYIFPFNQQIFILNIEDTDNTILFHLNYYNPSFLNNPEYSLIEVNKSDKSIKSYDLWKYSRIRNKVTGSIKANPSFECVELLNIEKSTICESYILRMYDKISSSKYYSVYSSIKNNKDKVEKLNNIRNDFKHNFESCNIDKVCIQETYESYINEMIKNF